MKRLETKNKKKWWISQYSIRNIAASLLGNPLTGKGIKTKIPGWGVLRAGEGRGTVRASLDF